MTVDRDELEELANNGLIEDLTDVFNKYASDNIKAVYKSFDDFQLKAATIDGQLMAVPGSEMISDQILYGFVKIGWIN